MEQQSNMITLAVLKETVEQEGRQTREAIVAIRQQIIGMYEIQQSDHDVLLKIGGRLNGLKERADNFDLELDRLKIKDTIGTVFASFIGPFAALIGHFIK